MNTEHSTEDCNNQKVNHKCSICGCNHSSLDRRCKAYRSAKREAANLAFETITKSKTNAKKKYLKDENFNAAQQTHPQTHSYSEALIHNNETTNIANKNELFGLCKDINCIINENTKNQKQTEDNKKNFAEGMERLGLAIESTNKIAVKFDETLKSLTTTMAQISRHECDIVRNEFEINLSQVKKEYTEFYNSNSNRIERIENQLRAITHPNTYQPQTTPPFQQQSQLQPTVNLKREASNTLYRPNSTNLIPMQPMSHYNHHYYDPPQALANLQNSGTTR